MIKFSGASSDHSCKTLPILADKSPKNFWDWVVGAEIICCWAKFEISDWFKILLAGTKILLSLTE